jgi:hypothetical protein
MPKWKYVVLNVNERGLQSVCVEISKSRILGQLVSKVLPCELHLIFFRVPAYVLTEHLVDLDEQKPVIAVIGGGDHHIVAVLEKGVDLRR